MRQGTAWESCLPSCALSEPPYDVSRMTLTSSMLPDQHTTFAIVLGWVPGEIDSEVHRKLTSGCPRDPPPWRSEGSRARKVNCDVVTAKPSASGTGAPGAGVDPQSCLSLGEGPGLSGSPPQQLGQPTVMGLRGSQHEGLSVPKGVVHPADDQPLDKDCLGGAMGSGGGRVSVFSLLAEPG